jgi:prepilin-type N-terminal cleavage/methylation domain-containing protein
VELAVNKNGFTLVELIIIIVIAGILAAVAISRYVNLRRNATDGIARGGAWRFKKSEQFDIQSACNQGNHWNLHNVIYCP